MKLPRDTLTEAPGTEIGSGPNIADLNAYWNYHYGTNWPTNASGAPLTRYQGYLLEMGLTLNADYTTSSTTPPTRISSEAAAPVCNSASSAGYMRRVISVSVVNCLAWGVRGNSVNQVGATKYVEFFMTEPSPPSGDPQSGSLYVEYIRTVTPESSSGKLHRVIQLVR